jgi:site-specific DNA-methyltransferase (adenine-specific)
MDYMNGLEPKSFELAIVDPPYGIGMDNSNKRTKPSRPNSYTMYPDFRYHKTDWDKQAPPKQYFDLLYESCVNQIIWGANYMCDMIPNGKGWIFWNKLNGLDNCFSDGEFAYASKGVQSKYFACSPFESLRGGKDRIHPTQKPVKLYRWLLKNYAKQGDRILDTHLGSGSSAIAAYDEGFDFVGIELDREYYDSAVKRFRQHISQTSLF